MGFQGATTDTGTDCVAVCLLASLPGSGAIVLVSGAIVLLLLYGSG